MRIVLGVIPLVENYCEHSEIWPATSDTCPGNENQKGDYNHE